MFAITCWIVGLYLVSKFEMALGRGWFGAAASWIGPGVFRDVQRRAAAGRRGAKRALLPPRLGPKNAPCSRAMAARAAARRQRHAARTSTGRNPDAKPRSSIPDGRPFVPHALDLDEEPREQSDASPSKTFRSACWSFHLPPEPLLVRTGAAAASGSRGVCVTEADRTPRRQHELAFQLPPTSSAARAAGAHRVRQPGAEGYRRADQIQVRGVQRPRLGDADQSRPGRDDLRVQARSRRRSTRASPRSARTCAWACRRNPF